MLSNFLRNKNCVNRNSFRNSTLYKFLIKIYFESFAYISFSTDKLKNIEFRHQFYHRCHFGAVLVQGVWNVFHYLPTCIVEYVSECCFFSNKKDKHTNKKQKKVRKIEKRKKPKKKRRKKTYVTYVISQQRDCVLKTVNFGKYFYIFVYFMFEMKTKIC